MKIKSVCESTGLSDRTIRYYIDEKLISPSYTENYLGRRTYDFSNKDIKELNDIAVLRKFDFTIDEIKSVINNAEASKEILYNVKSRTAKTVSDGQNKLTVLSQINADKSYTVAELADELSKASLELSEPEETVKTNILKIMRYVLKALKAILIFVIVWLPIALSLSLVVFKNYEYPVYEPEMIAKAIASLLPSIAVLIISRTKLKWKSLAQYVLLVLCILSIPVSFGLSFGIVSRSETTDFRNYRDFDAECLANRSMVFQELFPSWPHYFDNVKQADGTYETIYLDAHYYYNYHRFLDSTYDIYAEWPLNDEKYSEEVERATAVLRKYGEKNPDAYVELEKGDYNCLILYSGDRGAEPFYEVSGSYCYTIFAYNDKTNTVRYIYCYSLENGVYQPYYLELDW